MKKVVILSLLAASLCFGADYSQMSTQEMQNMRGSVPSADRDAFQAEMKNRVQNMNQEEKDSFMKNNSKDSSKQGPQDGTGNMYKGSKSGGGSGSGTRGGGGGRR